MYQMLNKTLWFYKNNYVQHIMQVFRTTALYKGSNCYKIINTKMYVAVQASQLVFQ